MSAGVGPGLLAQRARGPVGQVLLGSTEPRAGQGVVIEQADAAGLAAYRALRRAEFVERQGLFAGSDADDLDDDPRQVVLLALAEPDGVVLGGVRLGPARAGRDLGWWTGSRLVVGPPARRGAVGAALVRAACSRAEAEGALRFEATVQARHEPFFARLGWERLAPAVVGEVPHVRMRWPIRRVADLVAATKAPLARLLAGLHLGGPGFRGDDAAPVPGSDLVAACDAIVPALVEREPEWAGWCGVLVNVNDLTAMGATALGLLDAVGARDASFAARVLRGLREAAQAWAVPVLGGHTTLGAPASLAVTALGRAAAPVPGGGGRPGLAVSLTADLGGGWRRGQHGRQWDSTTCRRQEELAAMASVVARTRPAAAKDVSMAGIVGTLGMLAEASGCAAVLDVAAVPAPDGATLGDWLTCFPGFALLTADTPGRPVAPAGPAVSQACGQLLAGRGVRLRWPDGETTLALDAETTVMGAA